jgi:hypothetical protein
MPPAPKIYKVQLRYAINAPRDQRVVFYKEMIQGLKKAGFQFKIPLEDLPPNEPENTHKNLIEGQIAGTKAARLLRVPFVETVVLIPSNYVLPQKLGARVLVQMELASKFLLPQQRTLHRQVLALLARFKFDESVGYDHRGLSGRPFTRLRGTIGVDNLEVLFKDLRTQPTEWFAPRIPRAELPAPFATPCAS